MRPARSTITEARVALANSWERGTSMCDPFLSVLPVTGASVSLLAGPRGQATLCSSDDTASRLDEMQFDLGEGPCWSALSSRKPVLDSAIRSHTNPDYPVFSEAIRNGPDNVESMFAFPLAVGSLEIGAVDLYSAARSELTVEQIRDASSLATLASWQVLRRILSDPDGPSSPTESTSRESRREIHQATGMVLAQLNISVENADLLLRAHAFASSRSVAEVANDVVERRLDFSTPESPL